MNIAELKKVLPAILGLAMLAWPGAMTAESHKNQGSDNPPSLNGVTAKFALQNPIVRKPGPLKIHLMLHNTCDRIVNFSYEALILHIRVYDAAKKEIGQRSDAPILEPVAYPVRLAPNGKYETALSVDLWTYYNLVPGKYYLRFYYDLRLLNEKTLSKYYQKLYHNSPLVLWDMRYYSFSVKR